MNIIQLNRHLGADTLYFVEDLCSKIIREMLKGQPFVLRTDEGFSSEANGLFKLLDTLCDFWQFEKSKIHIETNNWHERHEFYQVSKAKFSTDFMNFIDHPIPEWNKEKTFGMFVGRGSKERIYSILRYQASKFKDQGLTSFHHAFDSMPIDHDVAAVSNFAKVPVNEIISIKPYSDIDQIRTVPILAPYNIKSALWNGVYEKIAIEVVNETTLYADSFQVTEKTLRPMYYKRPFLVIGSKGYLDKLKGMGFKTFDDIIPNWYDDHEEFFRVDSVFNILESLIASEQINDLIETCKEDIETNYRLLLELSQQHHVASRKNPYYYQNDYE